MTKEELEKVANDIVEVVSVLADDPGMVFMAFIIDTSVTPHHMSIRSNMTQEDAKILVNEIAQRMNNGDLACPAH